ncbi:MAG: hypothetical protein RLY93_07365 [Sumerlaeia bacterium]
MNQREKVLGIVTGVAILGYAAWHFGGAAVFDGLAVDGQALEAEQRRFEEDLDLILLEAPKIEREYLQIAGDVTADDEGLRPDLMFTNEVSTICKNFGFGAPQIATEIKNIEDVEDYQMVYIVTRGLDGNERGVVELLKEFDKRGYILDEVKLNARRDSDRVLAEITLGRLVSAFYF